MSPVIQPAALAPVPTPGPCEWPIDTTCCAGWGEFSLTIQTNATAWATEILDALTGHRYAHCPVNYRPCGPRCAGSFGYMTWPVGSPQSSGGVRPWIIPDIESGIWRNCHCSGGCTCRARCEVPFPTAVASVDEVTIDGVTLDPSAYRLDLYRGIPVLVRTDGDCWPQCQDMELGPDEVGAFNIVYRPGDPLPLAGQIAAGLLACEFAKSCAGQDCALPAQLSSLSRNGVEVTVVDPTTLLDDGRTGIAQVDLWVKSVNPFARRRPSTVWTPDKPGPRFSL